MGQFYYLFIVLEEGFFGGGSINIIDSAYQILNIHFVKIKLWC